MITDISGLRPDLYPSLHWSGEVGALAEIAADHPIRPLGTRFIYSDLNFIALPGELVHRVSKEPLDVYTERAHLCSAAHGGYELPSGARAERARIVPTDRQNGQLRWVSAEDPTAYRMGGVAGHAGGSNSDDIARFAEMLLSGGEGNREACGETVSEMTGPIELPGGVRRGLGWDIASPYDADMEMEFGPHAYGHTGYTGTMLWIDPSSETFLVVLASRLHPDDHGEVGLLRRRVAEAVVAPGLPRVAAGIDVLAEQHFAPLVGHRIGLLTNQTGRDSHGRRAIDMLAAARGVRLVAILTPEHGLNGDREGTVDSTQDFITGLPVYSLYGATRRPTGAMLTGIDTVVVDLQDAGVRFYTYPTTVGYVLEEAAKHNLAVYVLDRPNPISASIVQGPVMDTGLRSFTGYFPLPVRHGMTLGELARLFNGEERIGAHLTVIPMQGYQRRMRDDQTGLAWINPSPNLRSVDEATLYAGVGLIEGANVSVGRGTSSPFELIGAPWIDGTDLAHYLIRRGICGVLFEATRFTPDADRYARPDMLWGSDQPEQ